MVNHAVNLKASTLEEVLEIRKTRLSVDMYVINSNVWLHITYHSHSRTRKMSPAHNFVHKTKDMFQSFEAEIQQNFFFFFLRIILEVCQILHKNSLDFVKMKHVGLNVSKNEARVLRSCVCKCWWDCDNFWVLSKCLWHNDRAFLKQCRFLDVDKYNII